MHQEVIRNLESIQGALLRMNRSIQAEGTFGIMKNDRWYKRMKVKTAAQFQKQPNLWGEGKYALNLSSILRFVLKEHKKERAPK